jgi:hypothetical protein
MCIVGFLSKTQLKSGDGATYVNPSPDTFQIHKICDLYRGKVQNTKINRK